MRRTAGKEKMELVLFLVSFLSSTIGTVCGIGGGIVMKPLLDTLHLASAATISFLSGCTVFSMSCYSVCKALQKRESLIALKTGTPLSLGAALGGSTGSRLFGLAADISKQPEKVGGIQAVCLAVITLLTLLYTLLQDTIKTHTLKSPLPCGVVGLCLGTLSGFLGIGGGPVNLVVLHFFFSMPAKIAAQNSLYIILVSQAASILTTLLSQRLPAFRLIWLGIMVGGGILGGKAGRILNRRLSEKQTKIMLEWMIFLIFCICCYHAGVVLVSK